MSGAPHRAAFTDPETRALVRLARLWGVHAAYRDAFGRVRSPSPEALAALLRARGVPLAGPGDAPRALAERHGALARRSLPPAAVAWGGWVSLRLAIPPALAERPVTVLLELEEQSARSMRIAAEDAPVVGRRVVRGVAGDGAMERVERRLELPRRLPAGVHRVTVSVGPVVEHTVLIAAPERAFTAAGRRWGVFLPLYALRTSEHGPATYPDLGRLGRWAGELGAATVGTLPLLASFLEGGGGPFDPSPYTPASRLFLNELYIDPRAQAEHDGAEATPRRLAAGRLIDYRGLAAVRRRQLAPLAERFFDAAPESRRRDFEAFCEARSELDGYATFRALGEARGEPWRLWPEPLRSGRVPDGVAEEGRRRYHLYTQWAAHEQLTAARRTAREAGADLYLDLPLGVHPDSYDLWAHRELFAHGAAAGSPPDPFFTRGQCWGFPPLDPDRQRIDGYAYLRAVLRHHMDACGVLRVDHVMQLHRLFWVPEGGEASDGSYVTYPAEELFALLTLESRRAGTELVGEDLGTVPPAVHRRLERHDLAGMYVLPFAVDPGAEPPVKSPGRRQLACLDTHDMPTFRGWWEARDLALRRELELLDAEGEAVERDGRRRVREAVTEALARTGHLPAGDDPPAEAVARAVLEWLAASPARHLLINLEDLWGESEPQNVPGTGPERPNWRRLAWRTLEAIVEDPDIADLLRRIDAHRKEASP